MRTQRSRSRLILSGFFDREYHPDSKPGDPLMPDLRSIDPRRICLIKPSAFGDVVQTLPLLPVLKERFPRADVSWVVRSELRELLEGHPQLDEIIPFRRRGSWRETWNLLRELQQRRFDLVFDLQGLLRTAMMTWATRAPLRVGLETAREGAHWACHVTLRDTGRLVPAHLRYWRVAEALGMGDRRRETIVATAPDESRWAAEQLAPLSGPVLAVHPGARWATKRWPVERFAVVAARAARRFGFGTVVLGSGDEAATGGKFEFLLRRFAPSARCVNLAGKTTIKQLAALLQRADVLLSNDSGPMHLAAGLGRRVVGVFTCTDPSRSGPPVDENRETATTSLPCRNCYKKECPKRGHRHLACLNDVSTDAVWNAFEGLVVRHAKPRRAA
jgi:lipopolysaccharide heptosyltransferase II